MIEVASILLKWVEHVLSRRDELIGSAVYHLKQLEELSMKWKIFYVIRQLNCADDQLDSRIY